jgi:SGNH domain (fused to AT3 domains)
LIRPLVTVALAALALAAAPAAADAAPAREPRCFGAASRDAARPCTNPRLRLRVTPTPEQAALIPNLACQRSTLTEVLDECAYGLAAAKARETVAVIGDSHAAHWRAALRVVAERKRWRILEIGRPHCPLSLARPDSGEPISSQCATWNTQVIGWLRGHPEVSKVFVTGAARAPIVVPRGRTQFQERVAGYVGAWKRLPPSVQRLIVIRDNATDALETQDCVRRAMRRRQAAGPACALPRRRALVPDGAVAAARKLRRGGVRVVDLSDQFCDRRLCFPVIGGVLVRKDMDHLTQRFSATLGPILLRKLNALRW